MCGISGILSKNKGLIEPLLKSMMKSLHHRGPDDEGYFNNETIEINDINTDTTFLFNGYSTYAIAHSLPFNISWNIFAFH